MHRTFFYTGSVLGGYLSTKRYNRGVTRYNIDYMSEVLELEENRKEIFDRYGIGHGKK